MRITLSADEVVLPQGGYGDEDDGMCRGCGAEVSLWGDNPHNVRECLRELRHRINELEQTIKEHRCTNLVI